MAEQPITKLRDVILYIQYRVCCVIGNRNIMEFRIIIEGLWRVLARIQREAGMPGIF
ncbi:MAG: hypothetical protein QXX84_03000 [Sulfolobales archaeon]|jgi:hypothetical protein